MSSNASGASSTVDASSSADESSSNPAASQPPSEATTPTPMAGNKAFQFPKTKKVFFFSRRGRRENLSRSSLPDLFDYFSS